MSKLDELSWQASIVMLKGANAFCPGCKIEKRIPTNRNGAALHYIGTGEGDAYESHANSEAWVDVPEFTNQKP